jgi:hypothetical protein
MEERKHCDDHSGVCETVKILKERQDEVINALPKFMKNSTMWAFLSIFTIICLAIISFLYNGQQKILSEVKENREQTIAAIRENTDADFMYRRRMDRKMDLLMWKTGIRMPEEERDGRK